MRNPGIFTPIPDRRSSLSSSHHSYGFLWQIASTPLHSILLLLLLAVGGGRGRPRVRRLSVCAARAARSHHQTLNCVNTVWGKGRKRERGRGRKLLLTHRSSALSLSRSVARSLSRSKFDNFDLSHSYPSGARGEARRGTFSCGMLCVCTYVRSVVSG